MTNHKCEKNIFSENIHPSIKIEEKKALDFAKNVLEVFLQDEVIYKNSCLSEEEFDCLSFDILYCDSDKTHEINREYREKDYAADIITFAIFADGEEKFIFDGEINLGEIIISLDKIKQNAIEKGVEFEYELYFLIAHGIMHLLGFDHQTEEEYTFIVNAQTSGIEKVESLANEVE